MLHHHFNYHYWCLLHAHKHRLARRIARKMQQNPAAAATFSGEMRNVSRNIEQHVPGDKATKTGG
jgi:hypothetical protein